MGPYIMFYTKKEGWITMNKNRFPENPIVGETTILDEREFTYNDTMYSKPTWVITKE